MSRRLLISSLATAAVGALAFALRRIARGNGSGREAMVVALPPPAAPPAAPTASPPRTGPTRDQLYAEAKRLDIPGRSSMTKAQLQAAIAERRPPGEEPA